MSCLFKSFRHIRNAYNYNKVPVRYLNLLEYQSKQLLRENGVAIQDFCMVDTAGDKELDKFHVEEYVIKAQILAGGRGKGHFSNGFKGGVHITKDRSKIKDLVANMLGHNFSTSIFRESLLFAGDTQIRKCYKYSLGFQSSNCAKMLQLMVVFLCSQATFGHLLYEDKEIDGLKGAFAGYYEQFGGKLNTLIHKNLSSTEETIEQLQNAAETKLKSAAQTIEDLFKTSPNANDCIKAISDEILEYANDAVPKFKTYLQERSLGYIKLHNETETEFRKNLKEVKQIFEDMRRCNTFDCIDGNNVDCVLCPRKARLYENVKGELNWLYTTEIEVTNRVNAFIQFVDEKLADAKKCTE